jgi:cytochrome bd-type quinol oxidase subunit 2
MSTIESGLRQAATRHNFYVAIAISCAITVFVGFAPTFYLKRAFNTPALPTLVVIHGSVFTCWVLLLVTQTSLVRAGRTDLHRRLGVAGLGLAAAMVILGVLTAIEGARRGITAAGMDPNQFLAIPLASILLFAVFIWLAAKNRSRPDYHKRFVLLAMFSILTPAIARWPTVHQRPPIALGLTLLFLLAATGYDLRTRRSVHPVYIWGGLALLVSGPLRVAVAHSHLWQSITRQLVQ